MTEPRKTLAELAGTVKPYDRHLFVASTNRAFDWDPKLANEPRIKQFQKLGNQIKGTKVTAFDAMDKRCLQYEGIQIQPGDVLMFPDNLHFRVPEDKIEDFMGGLTAGGEALAK